MVDHRRDAGKKRLDLAGALLAGLFRQLFRKLTQNVRKYLQLCLDKGTQFVVGTAIKSQVRYGMVWCGCTLVENVGGWILLMPMLCY